MPKKGAQTGNQFERDVARKLGKAIYDDPDAIWRTHGSGGWKRAKDAKSGIHPGDLYPVKQVPFPFKFIVECKDRRGWSLDDFFNLKKKNKILEWWGKLQDDQKLAGDQYKNHCPILVITKAYYAELVVFSSEIFDWELELSSNRPFEKFYTGNTRVFTFSHFHFMDFDDFCNYLDKHYELWRNSSKRYLMVEEKSVTDETTHS